MSERIAKYISNRGYCSRRKAEYYINEGMVAVNNVVIKDLSTKILETDHLSINGIKLTDKPLGIITSHNDPQGRPTVFQALYPLVGYAISIGRLDINSSGLLLITNSPKLARYYELPSSKIIRKYHVRAYGIVDKDKLNSMQKELIIDDIKYQAIKIKLLKNSTINTNSNDIKTNIWFEIILSEGKNREIRKILNFFDLQVNRLVRIEYGSFKLDELDTGKIKEVPLKTIKSLIPSEVLS